MYKLRSLLLMVVFGGIAWLSGSAVYRYFTYNVEPVVQCIGLENGGTYCKDLRFSLISDHDYKVKCVRLLLNGKELDLGKHAFVKAKKFELPIVINTLHLPDGRHHLELEACDTSYRANVMRRPIDFCVDNKSLRAMFERQRYTVDQGKTLHAKISTNKPIRTAAMVFLDKEYHALPIAQDAMVYECFIPVDSEETPQDTTLFARVEDLVGNSVDIQAQVKVVAFPFKKQKGFVISQEKLHEESEVSVSHRVLEEALGKWVAESPRKKLWHGPFDTPIEVQRVATPFGEIRVTPERGRHLHKGIDLINRPRCTVWAAQTGKIIIKDRFFLTGNTVVIDHGLGVFTLYGHLEDFADIQVGDMIKKGSPVGKMGMTGYATGYHLHWELRINNTPVDPMEWTKTIY